MDGEGRSPVTLFLPQVSLNEGTAHFCYFRSYQMKYFFLYIGSILCLLCLHRAEPKALLLYLFSRSGLIS